MKKISTFFALMLMLVLMCPAGASAAGNMQLVVEPAKTEVAAGETVDFTVKLTNVDGLITNMQFNLDIPVGLEYVSGKVVSGGFDGMQAFNPNKDFQYAMFGNGNEVSDDVELLTFTCKATGYGKVTVDIVKDASLKVEENGKQYEVNVSAANLELTKGSGSAESGSSQESSSEGGASGESSESPKEYEVSVNGELEGDGDPVKLEDAIKKQEAEKAEAEKKAGAEDNTIFWAVMGVIGVLIVIVVILIIKKMPKKEKNHEKGNEEK